MNRRSWVLERKISTGFTGVLVNSIRHGVMDWGRRLVKKYDLLRCENNVVRVLEVRQGEVLVIDLY